MYGCSCCSLCDLKRIAGLFPFPLHHAQNHEGHEGNEESQEGSGSTSPSDEGHEGHEVNRLAAGNDQESHIAGQ